jgi:hypothetical protein
MEIFNFLAKEEVSMKVSVDMPINLCKSYFRSYILCTLFVVFIVDVAISRRLFFGFADNFVNSSMAKTVFPPDFCSQSDPSQLALFR